MRPRADQSPPAFERYKVIALSHIVRLVPSEPKSPAAASARPPRFGPQVAKLQS